MFCHLIFSYWIYTIVCTFISYFFWSASLIFVKFVNLYKVSSSCLKIIWMENRTETFLVSMFSLADHTLLYKTILKISHGFVSEVSIFNKPATCWYIRVEWILRHCFQQLSTAGLTLKMECDCYLSLQLGCTFWKTK